MILPQNHRERVQGDVHKMHQGQVRRMWQRCRHSVLTVPLVIRHLHTHDLENTHHLPWVELHIPLDSFL